MLYGHCVVCFATPPGAAANRGFRFYLRGKFSVCDDCWYTHRRKRRRL